MLVVTSNWCVPDGSLSAPPQASCICRLRSEVRRASLRSGFRADGRYVPVDEMAVVFAGDTFDWLTSREWTKGVRPWHCSRRAASARDRVMAASMRVGRRLLATLVAWGRHGVAVPQADRRGRPVARACRRVPVSIVLLRGDRDRWLDTVWPAQSTAISAGVVWCDGRTTVRHGDEIEPPWHGVGMPTLGESLAVDLVARFGEALDGIDGLRIQAAALTRCLATGRVGDCAARLADWLAARERRGRLSAGTSQAAIDAWNRAVAEWCRAARMLDLGPGDGTDLVASVAERMTLSLARLRELGSGSSGADTGRPCSEPVPVLDQPCEILGHPPAGAASPTGWHGRRLCIGPSAENDESMTGGLWAAESRGLAWLDPTGMISRGGGAADPALPAAALVVATATGPWLDWLPLGAGTIPGESGRRVWLSAGSPCADRVVDAA